MKQNACSRVQLGSDIRCSDLRIIGFSPRAQNSPRPSARSPIKGTDEMQGLTEVSYCRSPDWNPSMFTRSLFTLAALAVFSVSAVAQDIPAQLAPPQGATLLGRYAAKGVQIRLSCKRDHKRMGFQSPRGRAYRRTGQAVRQALWRSDMGSGRRLQGRRQGLGNRARTEAGRGSLAVTVGGFFLIGDTWRGTFCPTGEHRRRS